MAVRQDQVQLNIAFLTDESRAFARMVQENKAFISDLQKAQKEGRSLDGIINKMAESGKKVQNLDLSRLAPAQLIERARQLQQAIRLIPQSSPQFAQLSGELGRVNNQLKQINQTAKGIQAETKGGGLLQTVLGVAGGVGLVQLIQSGIRSLVNFGRQALAEADAQLKADAQIKEAIRSTGGVAGRSLADLKQQAEELQKVTLFGDEQTEGAQALLLTFKNIRGEIFDQTVPLVQDLATAFNQDLSSSAIQVGKALEDPIRGVTALRRVGITFSEDQQKMIKALVETNDLAGAQRIILRELETQVGGSARAAAAAGAGPLQVLKNVFGEIREAVGGLIISVVSDFIPGIKRAANALLELISVPLSEKLEEERQQFNGVTLSIYNAEVGTKARTEAIRKLQQQYPQFLGNINAEKVTNEQLKPILDEINQLYIIRVVLQKQQERLAPLVEAQVEQESNLVDNRVEYNRLLVRAAELSGINLQAFKTEAEQTQAVIAALNKTAQFREGLGFRQPLNEQARILSEILQTSSQIDATTVRQQLASKKLTEERQRENEVVAELKKTYGELVDVAKGFEGAATPGGGGAGAPGGGTVAGKIEKEAKAAEGSIAFLRKQISDLQKEIESSPGDPKLLAPLIKQLNEAEARLAELEKRIANLKNPPKEQPASIEDVTRQLGPGGAGLPGFTEEDLQAIIGFNDLKVEDEEKTTEELRKFRQGLSDEDTERRRLEIEAEKEKAKTIKDTAISAAQDVADAFFQIQANRIDQETSAELAALDRDYEARIAAAEGNNREQARLQQELDRKKEAIEKEAAKKRKALALKEAIVAGALAVVKALPNLFAAAAAGVAAAAQIAIIASQKFARGGFTGPGAGPRDSTGYKQAGVVHEGEYVIPKRMVDDRSTAPVVQWLENRRLRGYAEGGLVTANTTPGADIGLPGQSAPALANMDQFIVAVRQFARTAANFPTEVKSRVVYTEIEEVGTELNAVRSDAAL